MTSATPLYRGQGNEPFRTADPRPAAKRGQTVPYGVNGAPAPISPENIETAEAGEALGGHRAVRIATNGKAYLANPDATSRLTVGITTGAASLGATATIQIGGEIEESSWSWVDSELVWLAANGVLTQTVPTSGHAFQVGIPMGPARLRIEPQLIAKIS